LLESNVWLYSDILWDSRELLAYVPYNCLIVKLDTNTVDLVVEYHAANSDGFNWPNIIE